MRFIWTGRGRDHLDCGHSISLLGPQGYNLCLRRTYLFYYLYEIACLLENMRTVILYMCKQNVQSIPHHRNALGSGTFIPLLLVGEKHNSFYMFIMQNLGERWAAICKWTEDRWILLQKFLQSWQHFTEEQVPVRKKPV